MCLKRDRRFKSAVSFFFFVIPIVFLRCGFEAQNACVRVAHKDVLVYNCFGEMPMELI